MNTNQLKCFIEVYKSCSINKSAKKLFMTAQGVGKNIQSLESELDACLFVRTPNGVFPTESGKLFFERAGVILSQLEDLSASIQRLNKENMVLRIGYECGIFNIIPFEIIMKFMNENPNIQLSWNEYPNVQVHEMLQAGKLDYGFGIGVKRDHEGDTLIYRSLETKKAFLLVYEGHPLYCNESVNINMLKDKKILSLNENYYIWYHLLDLCEQSGFYPQVIVKASDSAALIHMCSQGIGVAVLPEYNCENIGYSNVKKIPLMDDFKLTVHLAYKKDSEKISTIREFDSFLRKYQIIAKKKSF